MPDTPSALLWGVRRYLAAPQARIIAIQRRSFLGGLSGSQFAYWQLRLRRAGVATNLTLVYKQGTVASGAFMQGAAQREALAYSLLPPHLPLNLPTVVAVDAPAGAIWMLPFSPSVATSHWRADWDKEDVRAVIADLARLHAAFWENSAQTSSWPWLLRPTTTDAGRLLAEGRESLEMLHDARCEDDVFTSPRLQRLLALARQPDILLELLNMGPTSLLHGDAGFQNIAITRDRRRRIWYDWQLASWGPVALDVATFLHPWGYLETTPPLSFQQMVEIYLGELARRGCIVDETSFFRQLDAAFLWRWLIQWAPLFGKHRKRLRPDVRQRLARAFERFHWPALARMQ